MRLTIFFIIVSLLFCASCTQKPTQAADYGTDGSDTANSKAVVTNGIVIHEQGGLQVTRAFLTTQNGSLLNKANRIQTGDTVYLNFTIGKGWVAADSRVSIGAQQTITTKEGATILSSPDLFAGQQAVPKEKAGQIQLKTVLTKADKDSQDLTVRYRVWDKAGPGELKGSYHLRLVRPAVE